MHLLGEFAGWIRWTLGTSSMLPVLCGSVDPGACGPSWAIPSPAVLHHQLCTQKQGTDATHSGHEQHMLTTSVWQVLW